MSLFIEEYEADSLGTVSGNSADPVPSPMPEHSALEAVFQISVSAGGTILGSTVMEFIRRGIGGKEVSLAQVHITQEQLRKAHEKAEEESPPTPEKPQAKMV